MKNVMKGVLSVALMFSMSTAFADADAKRKNKCKHNDKFYKVECKTKGGTSNCGNLQTGFGWTCNNNIVQGGNVSQGTNNLSSIVQRHGSGGEACSCGDYANTNLALAAEAKGQSNSATCGSSHQVYEFGCGWPNKWKAGSSRLYAVNPLKFPTVISKSSDASGYEMGSAIQATSFEWNYTDDKLVLGGLTGELHKYTPDMTNDYCTIVISVGKVTGVDSNGDDVETELYKFSATIIGEELVIIDPSGTFTSSDFTSSTFNGGVKFTLNASSKTLPLSADVSEDDEINLSFYTDSDNLEDGTGRTGLSTVGLAKLQKNLESKQNVVFNLYGNPIQNEVKYGIAIGDLSSDFSAKMRVEDITGKLIKEFVIQVKNNEQTYSMPVGDLSNGVYYMSFKYGDKQYGHKLIVERK